MAGVVASHTVLPVIGVPINATPLNGLDARTRAWLLGFLHQLKDAGKTLVIATHDQSLADEVADYFVYMGDFHEYGDRPHVHINQ